MERITLSELLPGVRFFEGVSDAAIVVLENVAKLSIGCLGSCHGYMAKVPASLSNRAQTFIHNLKQGEEKY